MKFGGASLCGLSICLLCVLNSCKPFNPLIKYNYFNGNTLYNDSIKISLAFYGDIKLKSLNEKKIRNSIKGIKEISQKDFLVYGSTTVEPMYNVFLFYRNSKNKKKDIDATESIKLILKDSIKKKVLFQINKNNKQAFIFLEAIDGDFNSILTDGRALAEAVSFNINFKKLTFSKVFETYKDNANYLFVREKLKSAPIPISKKNNWMQFQYLATINSFMVNNVEHDSLIDEFTKRKKKYLSPLLDTLFLTSKALKNNFVIEKIADLSKNTRVVMLNENHWCPKNRIFATKLLKPLKDAGYTHLALEALYEKQDSLLNKPKSFLTMNSGYYTREPFFGNLIRKAKDLGFKIIGYENFNQVISREQGEAENIKKILDNNPSDKVFVYAGFDHIYEESNSKGVRRMASFFKEKSGINPLTIDQVNIVSDTKDELTMAPYNTLIDIDKLWRPVDYFVVNNMKDDLKEIYTSDELFEIKLIDDFLLLNKNKDLLISIYKEEEFLKYKLRSVPI